ncbi:hypothetical protein [Phormidium nigroviride]|nr:hypothetical protein [Oscillatoria nigro-viridis]
MIPRIDRVADTTFEILGQIFRLYGLCGKGLSLNAEKIDSRKR